MKFDILKWLIFFGISILLACGAYSICQEENSKLLLAFGLAVSLITMSALICIELPDYPRSQVNLRVAASVFVVVSMVLNVVYCFISFSIIGYLTPNGVLLLTALLTSRSIINSKQ